MVGDLNVGEGMILIPIVVYCNTLISSRGVRVLISMQRGRNSIDSCSFVDSKLSAPKELP